MQPPEKLLRYYGMHSGIYDATRWSFLFGRQRLLRELGLSDPPERILEVGCGTGVNLLTLGRLFPQAQLLGMDASGRMLERARRRLGPLSSRVTLREAYYHSPLRLQPAPDLICFSYCLSMVNPGWDRVIEAAAADLAPHGAIAVVDFHASSHPWFRRWMAWNHVRLEGHLLPALAAHFATTSLKVESAYAGLWRYFLFVGRARSRPEPGHVLPVSHRTSVRIPLSGCSV